MSDVYDVIIAGAGAAGLFCAANLSGCRVLVLEKMNHPAKKLLLSGLGQCNITHSGNISEFLKHYGNHGNFLKPSLLSFTNNDTLKFFENLGLRFFENDDGKYFPVSKSAQDVLDALLKACDISKAEIHLNEPVIKVSKTDSGFSVKTNLKKYSSKYFVITSGGMSYPKTGSDGSGYMLAESLSHKIVKPKPSLSPVHIKNFELKRLCGVSLENAEVSLWKNNKKASSSSGGILITAFGFSGPVILDMSRYFDSGDVLKINFTNLSRDELNRLLIERSSKEGSRHAENILWGLSCPERLAKLICELSGIPEDTLASQMSSDMRKRLVKNLSEYEAVISKSGSFTEAMCTAGGICLDEVDKKSCESKIIPGLFFAGEVLDIDGDTGGYNIQAAFSTAYSVSKKILNDIRQ